MTAVGARRSEYIFPAIAMLLSLAGCGTQPSVTTGLPPEQTPREILSLKDELAKVREQLSNERLAAKEVIMRLETENRELVANRKAWEQEYASLVKASREAGDMRQVSVEQMASHMAEMREELTQMRKIIERAFPIKSNDKSTETPTGPDPFDAPVKSEPPTTHPR